MYRGVAFSKLQKTSFLEGEENGKRKNAAASQVEPTTASSNKSPGKKKKKNKANAEDKAGSAPVKDASQSEQPAENGDDPPKRVLTEEEKAERKRLKKEKQKDRKMARKIAAQRKESIMILLKDGTISTDTLFLSSNRSLSSILLVPEESICLLRSPLVTASYCFNEIRCMLRDAKRRLSSALFGDGTEGGRKVGDVLAILVFSLMMGVLLTSTYIWKIAEDEESIEVKQDLAWYAYWICLGVLSSVGFGTGLHTFVLYLGPFIAKVTLAAEECSTLDFPRPPYPNHIICPFEDPIEIEMESDQDHHTVWDILQKVRWESIAWGFGTALGELPPYFMAKASRLSGTDDSSIPLKKGCCIIRGIRQCMRNFVMGIGFWGILLCASIPNPLFDLAGITCGHFLVPFLTFFTATVIGKSVIKSQLQTVLVILSFNENSLKSVLRFIGKIPMLGLAMQREFMEFMDYQRATIHDKKVAKSGGLLKNLADVFSFLIIIYFVVSIVNGLARSYHRRISRSTQGRKSNKDKKMRKRMLATQAHL